MISKRPFIVIVPGGTQNPAHYAYLSHLLQLAGYPVFSALLPSVGATGKVTEEDDMNYIRNSMLIPILNLKGHDVIMFMHSYGSVPGSAAAQSLSKTTRTAQGKKTGVIAQIHSSAALVMGGDGKDILSAFWGTYLPFIRSDVSTYSRFTIDTFSVRLMH